MDWMDWDVNRKALEDAERLAYEAVTDRRVIAVLDVLAPRWNGTRMPVFEWGHEEAPDAESMILLATEIVAALE